MSTFIHVVVKGYGNMDLTRYFRQCFCCVMVINLSRILNIYETKVNNQSLHTSLLKSWNTPVF
jgi:hypothetical protein